MSSGRLFRLAAVALAASGVALALGLILHPMPPYEVSVPTTQWAVSHFLWWIGSVLGIVGLAGVYLRDRAMLGITGFVGTGLAVAGLTMIAGAMYFEAFVAPSLAARVPEAFASFPGGGGWEGFLAGVLASGALFGIGFLLLGIQLFRAGTARWGVLAAVVGGVPFAVNFLLPRPVAIVAVALFAIGLAWLGHALWHGVEDPRLPAAS